MADISGFFLCAGIFCALLRDDKIENEFGCLTWPLHHYRMATVIQQINTGAWKSLFERSCPRHIHNLKINTGMNINSVHVHGGVFSIKAMIIFSARTWSCLPQIICKGVVICCTWSCKAYLGLSPIISMKTVNRVENTYNSAK